MNMKYAGIFMLVLALVVSVTTNTQVSGETELKTGILAENGIQSRSPEKNYNVFLPIVADGRESYPTENVYSMFADVLDGAVFENGTLGNRWKDWSWGTTMDGSEIESQAWGGVYAHAEDEIGIDEYESLTISVESSSPLWVGLVAEEDQPVIAVTSGTTELRIDELLDGVDSFSGIQIRSAEAQTYTLELVELKAEADEPDNDNQCGSLSQEAEDGDLFGEMALVTSSGRGAVRANDENASLNSEDRIEFCVDVPASGDYQIAGWVKARDTGSNSIFVTVDGLPGNGMVWHMTPSTVFYREIVSNGGNPNGDNAPQTIYLSKGQHEVVFYAREDEVLLDRFELFEVSDYEDPEPDEPELPLKDYDFPLIDYSNAGIIGGIPHYSNEIRVSGYSQRDIENAISKAQPYTRIILPAGTYNISSLNITKSNIALVGEGNGCGETIIKFGSADTGIKVGNGGGISGSSARITAGANRNAKTIKVDNVSAFRIGDYVYLLQDDDRNLYRSDLSRNYGKDSDWVEGNAEQINKVVAKDGNTLTLEGGLNLDYQTALNPRISKINNMISGVGIENLTIERTVNDSAEHQSANIFFTYAANSWVKGVHSKNSVRAHFYFNRSYKGEVRGSYADRSFNNGPGGHGYGVRLQDGTTDMLIENNIGKLLRHSYIAQIGANGNVFGYNYSADPYGEGFGEIYTDLSVHGGFGYSNLFEGNQAQHAKIDNIHASNSWNLFFRNRLEQDIDNYTYKSQLMSKGATTPHIWVHENQYDNTFLANEIGFSGANPATQAVGFSDGRTRDNLTVCKFTNSSDGERGCGRTRETTLLHGTHDYLTGKTSWDSSMGATNFPASAYKNAKPSFWGNTAWPTFGPDRLSVGESNKIIPAKVQFLNAQKGEGSFCYMD